MGCIKIDTSDVSIERGGLNIGIDLLAAGCAAEKFDSSGELKNPTRLRPKQNHVNFKTYKLGHHFFLTFLLKS